jgi:DNA polymerase (family 10)
MENAMIARRLAEHARTLEGQGDNLYRIRSYRRAAQTVLGLERPVCQLIEEDAGAVLQTLPGIGSHLAFTIEHLVRTGEFLTYEEARERAGPLRLSG